MLPIDLNQPPVGDTIVVNLPRLCTVISSEDAQHRGVRVKLQENEGHKHVLNVYIKKDDLIPLAPKRVYTTDF